MRQIDQMTPNIRNRFAFLGLSSLLTNQAISPPINPKKSGNKYQRLDTVLSFSREGCLTPHFGHISAFISISAPQFTQCLVFRSIPNLNSLFFLKKFGRNNYNRVYPIILALNSLEDKFSLYWIRVLDVFLDIR